MEEIYFREKEREKLEFSENNIEKSRTCERIVFTRDSFPLSLSRLVKARESVT